ncbi:hypothetical protein D3C72_2039190 [compost metagenome]
MWSVREAGFRQGHGFPRKTVDAVPWDGSEVAQARLSVMPRREEGADDMVTDRECLHACANRCDFPGAVRHGDAPFRQAPTAGNYGVVMIVERTGTYADGDLALSRRGGRGFPDDNVLESGRWIEVNGF